MQGDRVDPTHSLRVGRDVLLRAQVPDKNGPVPRAGQRVHVIGAQRETQSRSLLVVGHDMRTCTVRRDVRPYVTRKKLSER